MQCKAKTKGGKPCRGQAISGATVCRLHGGSAPQVREAARVRLLELIDPALATLARSLKLKGPAANVALAAARDVLDRTGFKPTEKAEITTQSSEAAQLAALLTPDELAAIRSRLADQPESD